MVLSAEKKARHKKTALKNSAPFYKQTIPNFLN